MQVYKQDIVERGEPTTADAVRIGEIVVLLRPGFLRRAEVMEDWEVDINDPRSIIAALKNGGAKADIFTFMQRIPESEPKFEYYMEWENAAAIPITDFEQWWMKQINDKVRNRARQAGKKGVEIKVVPFDDEFVRQLSNLYNETPIRQGKPFWHYGKDLQTLWETHSKFSEKSDFIGAFFEGEMIGFIKLVDAGRYTRTMHVLSMIKHRNKSVINALMAEAVRICAERNVPYLAYGQYDYGKKGADSLTQFKKQNGFNRIELPRYYVPLTLKGKLALRLGLHNGITAALPEKVLMPLLALRKKFYSLKKGSPQKA